MDKSEKTTGDGEALKTIRSNLETMVVQQLRVLDSLRNLNNLDSTRLMEVGRNLAAQTPSMLSDLLRSGLQAQTDFLDIHAKNFERIAGELFRDKPRGSRDAKIRLTMEGSPGGVAQARFRVKNPHDTEAAVSFTVPILRDADKKPLDARVRFQRFDAAKNEVSLDTALAANGGDGLFKVSIEIPASATTGIYHGEGHVVADSDVLGSISYSIEVRAEAVPELSATAKLQENQPYSESSEIKVTAPTDRGGMLSIASPIKFKAKDREFRATLHLVGEDENDLLELEAGESADCQIRITARPGATLEPGKYHAVASILLDSKVLTRVVIRVELAKPTGGTAPSRSKPGTKS